MTSRIGIPCPGAAAGPGTQLGRAGPRGRRPRAVLGPWLSLRSGLSLRSWLSLRPRRALFALAPSKGKRDHNRENRISHSHAPLGLTLRKPRFQAWRREIKKGESFSGNIPLPA